MAYRCEVHDNSSMNRTKVRFNAVETGQNEWGGKWNQDTVTYHFMNLSDDAERIYPNTSERLFLNLAMTTWDFEIPLKLKWVPLHDNADIEITFSKIDPYWKDRGSVLAYAYLPQNNPSSFNGVIVFNDNYYWGPKEGVIDITNPDGSTSKVRVYNMITVLIHEIGHSLGLNHDQHNDTEDIMDPMYNGRLDLSDWDRLRIRAKYGIRRWNWRLYARMQRWLALRKVRF